MNCEDLKLGNGREDRWKMEKDNKMDKFWGNWLKDRKWC